MSIPSYGFLLALLLMSSSVSVYAVSYDTSTSATVYQNQALYLDAPFAPVLSPGDFINGFVTVRNDPWLINGNVSFDIAGQGRADATSLVAALTLAADMAAARQ